MEMPIDLSIELNEFDSTWVSESRPFGFHLTVCDALDCDWATIPLVERQLVHLSRGEPLSPAGTTRSGIFAASGTRSDVKEPEEQVNELSNSPANRC